MFHSHTHTHTSMKNLILNSIYSNYFIAISIGQHGPSDEEFNWTLKTHRNNILELKIPKTKLLVLMNCRNYY
jgi:hypothetical protein